MPTITVTTAIFHRLIFWLIVQFVFVDFATRLGLVFSSKIASAIPPMPLAMVLPPGIFPEATLSVLGLSLNQSLCNALLLLPQRIYLPLSL